jgi:regulatory protein
MAGRRRPAEGGAAREPRVLDAKAARLVAADLLARRAWTQAELTRRLTRRGAPPDVAAAVVADLVARGYVDDAAFARHFVETRSARGYGASRIAVDLRARGVARDLVAGALGDVDVALQLDRARAIARRQLPTLRRVAPERAAVRLRDHLLRRGFAAAIVIRVIREMVHVDR